MNCQKALEKLYRILDKEGTEIDENLIREHMEMCPPCCEAFRIEKAFQDFLDSKFSNQKTKTEKLEVLKSSLCEKLDLIDCEGIEDSSTASEVLVTPISSNNILVASLIMAASVILVFGIASIGNLFDYHYMNYSTIENAHFAAEDNAEQFVEFASSVTETARDDFNYEISRKVQGYDLVGGVMMDYKGTEVTHFLYSNNNSMVSVFIAPKGKIKIPDDIANSKEVRELGDFFEHRCHGCAIVYYETENSIVITATRDLSLELLEFIPGQSILIAWQLFLPNLME